MKSILYISLYAIVTFNLWLLLSPLYEGGNVVEATYVIAFLMGAWWSEGEHRWWVSGVGFGIGSGMFLIFNVPDSSLMHIPALIGVVLITTIMITSLKPRRR